MPIRFAEFEFDAACYRLTGRDGAVPLEPKVAELLALLVEHRDRVVSRREIFERLWPNQDIGDAALSRLLYELRKALGDSAEQPRLVRTVPRRGLQFIGEVQTEPPEPRPHRNRLLSAAGLLAVVVAGVVVALYQRAPQSDSPADGADRGVPRIAILNGVAAGVGGDAGMVLVTVGDLLWSRLASIQGIEVRSPFFSDALSAAAPSVAAFGRESQVDFVLSLTAAPSSSADVVNLRAELIEMKGDDTPWRAPLRPIELPMPSSDQDLMRFLEARDLLVERIAGEIGMLVTGAGLDSAPRSLEAWRLYLLARGKLAQLSCDTAGSRGLLERVVELDPRFVLGWVMLGLAHYNEAWACGAGRDSALKALAASRRALELDPTNGGATFLQVSILAELGQADRGVQIARERLARKENDSLTMTGLAYALTFQGQLEQAAAMIERAIEVDPLVLAVESGVTPTVFLHQRNWRRYLDLAPAGDGPIERYYRAYAHWQAGDIGQARDLLEPCGNASSADVFSAFCEALGAILGNQPDEALTRLMALQLDRESELAIDGEIDFKIAQLLAEAGHPEAALASVHAAWERGFRCRICYDNDPLLASVRDSDELVGRLNSVFALPSTP